MSNRLAALVDAGVNDARERIRRQISHDYFMAFAEIDRMARSARRSIGQRWRYMKADLQRKEIHGGE